MIYDYRNAPRNKKIWAYAFSYHSAKESFSLKKEPVLGEIDDRNSYPQSDYFREYGKGGKLKNTNVYADARRYADTYEEAVRGYNELVQGWVEYFEDKIKETEEFLL